MSMTHYHYRKDVFEQVDSDHGPDYTTFSQYAATHGTSAAAALWYATGGDVHEMNDLIDLYGDGQVQWACAQMNHATREVGKELIFD